MNRHTFRPPVDMRALAAIAMLHFIPLMNAKPGDEAVPPLSPEGQGEKALSAKRLTPKTNVAPGKQFPVPEHVLDDVDRKLRESNGHPLDHKP